jgi:HNH endonuclease
MPFNLTCGQCGAQFTRDHRPRAKEGSYCSRDCYWASMVKAAPNRMCAGCGEEFDPRMEGRTSSLARDYCTRACYDYSRAHVVERWLEDQSGDDCWRWPHGLNKDGYGITCRTGEGQQLVHRVVWKLLVGEIPDDMTLDHMCHNRDDNCYAGRGCLHRRCANPAHLLIAEGVDNTLRGKNLFAVNARKTHCDSGHKFTAANTYIRPDSGDRGCRTCRNAATRRYKARKAARKDAAQL